MSPRVGTLVFKQGVEAAFRLGMEGKCDVTGLLQPSSGSNGIEGTEIRVPRTRRLNLESFDDSKTTFLYYSPLPEPDVIPKTPVCPRPIETTLLWAFLLMT